MSCRISLVDERDSLDCVFVCHKLNSEEFKKKQKKKRMLGKLIERTIYLFSFL